ncbi:MAG: hypothetical protein NTW29_20700 [Bacteroidetes bacterium]|nr:hypothetical protein [Bacteroidota bacterium]
MAFAEGLACALGAKANVPFVRLAKIELKKMCGGENKKYRRVGNECRLTRCPFEIWSVCWSLVEMVCFCVNVQFLVVCLWLHCRLLGLLITQKYAKVFTPTNFAFFIILVYNHYVRKIFAIEFICANTRL